MLHIDRDNILIGKKTADMFYTYKVIYYKRDIYYMQIMKVLIDNHCYSL